MPQTTIYVSPRSLGAPDERPPAVVTTDLARLFAGSAGTGRYLAAVEAGRPWPCSGRTAPARRRSCVCWRPPSGRRTAAPRVDGLDVGARRGPRPRACRLPVARHRAVRRSDRSREPRLRSDHARHARSATRVDARAGRRRPRGPCRRPGRGLLRRHAQAPGPRPHPARPARRSSCSTSRRPRSTPRAWASSSSCSTRGSEVGVTVLVASHSTERLEPLPRRARRPRARPRGRGRAAAGVTCDATGPGRRPASGGGGPMSLLRREASIAMAIARKDATAELRGRQRRGQHALLRRGRAPALRLRPRTRLRPPGGRRAGAAMAGDRLRRHPGRRPPPSARDR